MAEYASKKYILMHKTVPVCHIELDEATCVISAVAPAGNPAHVPVGIAVKGDSIDRAALNEWWKGRAIPASRDGIEKALTELGISSTQRLLDKALGLSLSDQYWICPESSDVTWEKVNFFDNPFSDDVGNILFGQAASSERMSLMSPDNTSDGWLKKKWTIIDGKRCLIKGGSGATQQEPYNEVIASQIMERLGIPHVPYTLIMQEDYPYSVCENFITPQTELISAWYIMQTEKKPNHVSVYQHYLNCCDRLGIPGVRQALDQMLVLDFLIANEDRHQNNFGVVRNAQTLEYIGAAPIFDSGTSLWHDKPTTMIGGVKGLTCKPFKTTHEEQIKLVSSFDWLDLSRLAGIDEELRELMRGSLFIDEARCNALCNALGQRVTMLESLASNHITPFSPGTTAGDVARDISYSGTPDDDEDEELDR